MNGLKVSELARRSGVPATTVRYYEQEGLLPAQRSASGYRLYDDAAVDRLAFIRTAKSLGLPLPEIRRLLGPWEHGACADVQGELAPLLDRRIAETRRRITELSAFTERLSRARVQLDAIDREGQCDPSCTFLGRGTGPALASLPRRSAPGADDPAVIACTLGVDDRTERPEQWRDALRAVTGRTAITDGVRLTFDPEGVRIGQVAELAAAEARCCEFFDLRLRLGQPTTLEVRAPTEALVLVHELFGAPDT